MEATEQQSKPCGTAQVTRSWTWPGSSQKSPWHARTLLSFSDPPQIAVSLISVL